MDLAKDRPIRVINGGHFFCVTSIFKVLPGFKVCKNGMDVLYDEPQNSLQVASSLKYFGNNNGYFSGEKCLLVQVCPCFCDLCRP